MIPLSPLSPGKPSIPGKPAGPLRPGKPTGPSGPNFFFEINKCHMSSQLHNCAQKKYQIRDFSKRVTFNPY